MINPNTTATWNPRPTSDFISKGISTACDKHLNIALSAEANPISARTSNFTTNKEMEKPMTQQTIHIKQRGKINSRSATKNTFQYSQKGKAKTKSGETRKKNVFPEIIPQWDKTATKGMT
ncbi:hypothetical protein KFK09_024305 [Dendrobium nobile]|uniref:Uncharacterized protein n=1 Tax=Dendrobium nobile TaxID=94219 RepID=A0A8T3ADQ2_DENNO|nr:hypothetical protein KFK09_024305 [Dendrobium nobile]